MAGFKIPKLTSEETLIDLSEYGGEGFLSVRTLTNLDSRDYIDFIKKLARKDGIQITKETSLDEIASNEYSMETMTFMIERCVRGVNEDGSKSEIDANDLYEAPIELLNKIGEIIGDSTKFPLAQTAGAGQK